MGDDDDDDENNHTNRDKMATMARRWSRYTDDFHTFVIEMFGGASVRQKIPNHNAQCKMVIMITIKKRKWQII